MLKFECEVLEDYIVWSGRRGREKEEGGGGERRWEAERRRAKEKEDGGERREGEVSITFLCRSTVIHG